MSERLSPIAEMLAGFAVAGVIGYAGFRALYGNQPPGAVFSFITALLLAYDPARRLARSQVTLERSLVNARMIYEILDLEPQQGDAGRAAAQVGDGEVRSTMSASPIRRARRCSTASASSPRPARPRRSSAGPAPARRR